MQRIENLVGVGEDGDVNNKKSNGVPLPVGSSAFSDMTPRHHQMPFQSHDFQRCLFDTPESLMGSPQFDMFSSPFRGGSQFGRAAPPPTRCSFCNNDIPGRHPRFACSHTICASCSSVSEASRCPVPMCNGTSIPNTSTPQFPAQMFLSPTITDSSMHAASLQSAYRNTSNGIASALQPSALGMGGEPFSIWENINNKLDTSITYETLSGSDDHPPVFSPVGSDCRFSTMSHPPAPPPSATMPHPPSMQQQHQQHSMMSGPAPHCAPCGAEVRALAFCANCRELLCADCVIAHHRVRITKEHSVISLEQLLQHIVSSPLKESVVPTSASSSVGSAGAASSDNSSPRPSSVCSVHDAPVVGACSTCCGTVICFHCLPLHSNHQLSRPADLRSAASLLLCESRQKEKSIEEAMEGVGRMTDRVDSSVQAVATELRYVIHTHITALEERKRELLRRLDTVRKTKVNALKAQGDSLMARKNALNQVLKSLDCALSSGDELEESQLVAAFEQLMQFFAQPLQLDPQETDLVKFITPDTQLLASIRSMGELESGACARTSTLMGEGFRRAIRDRQCSVYVQLRDACGDVSTTACGRNQVTAHVLGPDGHPLDVQIAERETGVVSVSYYPTVDGIHTLNIMVRGVSIR